MELDKVFLFFIILFLSIDSVLASSIGISPSAVEFNELNETKQVRIFNPNDWEVYVDHDNRDNIEIWLEQESISAKGNIRAYLKLKTQSDSPNMDEIIIFKFRPVSEKGIALSSAVGLKVVYKGRSEPEEEGIGRYAEQYRVKDIIQEENESKRGDEYSKIKQKLTGILIFLGIIILGLGVYFRRKIPKIFNSFIYSKSKFR